MIRIVRRPSNGFASWHLNRGGPLPTPVWGADMRHHGTDTLHDASGYGREADVVGGAGWDATPWGPAIDPSTNGGFKTAWSWAGYPHTIALWASTTTGHQRALSIVDNGSGAQLFGIQLSTTVGFSYYFMDGTNKNITWGTPTAGTRYFVVAVSAANNDHYLYVDGVERGTSSTASSPINLDDLTVGYFGDSTPAYSPSGSRVYGAWYWEMALNASQVWQLYASQLNGGPGVLGAMRRLVPVAGASGGPTVVEESFYNAAPYTQDEVIGTASATGGSAPYTWRLTGETAP